MAIKDALRRKFPKCEKKRLDLCRTNRLKNPALFDADEMAKIVKWKDPRNDELAVCDLSQDSGAAVYFIENKTDPADMGERHKGHRKETGADAQKRRDQKIEHIKQQLQGGADMLQKQMRADFAREPFKFRAVLAGEKIPPSWHLRLLKNTVSFCGKTSGIICKCAGDGNTELDPI